MSATRHPVRRRVAWVLGVLALLVLGLLLLALPFRGVEAHAQAAQEELDAAVDELRAGELEAADTHIARARTEVDEVTGVTDGFGAKVWSVVPVAGSGVRDVRRLGTAVDEVTSALEVVSELHPQLTGEAATLFTEESGIDLDTLDRVLAGIDEMTAHLAAAEAELTGIDGTAPVVGDTVAQARDDALAQVEPATETLQDMDPLLATLPSILGAEDKKRYVVAMLNPAEIRYSGGAALAFSPIMLDQGRFSRGVVTDQGIRSPAFRPIQWEHVEGNPFVSPYRQRITHANLAPSWQVSGEEMLRAWTRIKKWEADGLIALDVVAISRLLEVTGPLQVPGVGEVGADEVVELTIGSYDQYDDEQTAQRRRINRALIPAFVDRLFAGVDLIDTIRALADAADQRHFALYFRDTPAQDAAAQIGFDGDLSQTDQDYIGVFTQNLVGAKSDYYQRKRLQSEVEVAKDGSAHVVLTADIENTATAILGDDKSGYNTRWITMDVAAFLPREVKVTRASLGGEPFRPELGDYFGRPFFKRPYQLGPGETVRLVVEYDVPAAAPQESGAETKGALAYGLAIDRHPTVTPEQLSVRVRWPAGYAPSDLPEGWEATGRRTAGFDTEALDGSHEWVLTGRAT